MNYQNIGKSVKIFTKNKLKFIFFIILIILLIVYYKTYFNPEHTGTLLPFLSDGIFPELIGVCIEFIIILCIIDFLQKKEEMSRKIISEKRLREIFIFFLKHIDDYLPNDIKINVNYPENQDGKNEFLYGKHYEKNQAYFDMLIEYFKENQITDVIKDKIKNYCEREIATVRCLTPVVATLDDQNFKSWLRIIFYMDAIIANEHTVERCMVNIINHMKKFEGASKKNGWLIKDD
ncbi:hypothetical protein ACIH2S_11215 [Providencia sp. PAZ2]|uniref:hypothetical protein n=1 Tax=Providencia lanzhouensis TaxID=3378099 RepID=UPI003D2C7653